MHRVIFILMLIPVILPAKVTDLYPEQDSASVYNHFREARDGDTLRFNEGIYYIHSIVVTKSLVLLGHGNCILDGSGKFEILTISARAGTIQGLTLRNSGYSSMNDFAAIKVIDASNLLITDNTILDSYFAIHLSNSSRCTIRNNTIEGKAISEQLNGNAIHAWKSHHLIIENNTVSRHRDGIYLEFVTHSRITGNLSQLQMRYGLHFMFSNDDVYTNNTFEENGAGVAVMYSKRVTMKENLFRNNWGPSAYGLLLKDISDSEISQNRFEENTRGIHMEGTSRIQLRHNSFKDNGWGIAIQASCNDNSFSYNNFISNSFDVSTNGHVILNVFEHNYWDEYEGYDLNKDGTGDIPYHPLSLFGLLIEQNPSMLILVKSFMMQLFERMEKAIPSLTPEHFVDLHPLMKPYTL